ncbi:MAG: hypothetical protein ABIH76_05135 [Candidatus Bathyarchaeota archaeon]
MKQAMPRVKLFGGDKELTMQQALRLMKEGTVVPTNKIADIAVRGSFGTLDEKTRGTLLLDAALSSTLFTKSKTGEPLGDRITLSESDDGTTLTTIVPPELRAEKNCGFVINLTPDNFEVESNGKETIITLNPKQGELVLLEDPLQEIGWGKASDSTLWVPIKNETNDSEDRLIYTGPEAHTQLVARSHWDSQRVQGVEVYCKASDTFRLFIPGD